MSVWNYHRPLQNLISMPNSSINIIGADTLIKAQNLHQFDKFVIHIWTIYIFIIANSAVRTFRGLDQRIEKRRNVEIRPRQAMRSGRR
jgi:hypothetical protein